MTRSQMIAVIYKKITDEGWWLSEEFVRDIYKAIEDYIDVE